MSGDLKFYRDARLPSPSGFFFFSYLFFSPSFLSQPPLWFLSCKFNLGRTSKHPF